MTMRAHIALVLALSLAPPAIAETIVGRGSVVDGGTLEVRSQRLRLGAVDAPESGQLCGDENGENYHCVVDTEWALTSRVSIKSKALYLRVEDDSFRRTSQNSGPGDSKRFDHEDYVWIGRIGVNFKLGGEAAQAHAVTQ
jgi:hypothetical protein